MTDHEKELHDQTRELLDSVRASFQLLEAYSNKAREMAEARLLFEDAHDVECDCVSSSYADLREMADAVRHMLNTYGQMMAGAAQNIIDHDARTQAGDQVKAFLEKLFQKPQEAEPPQQPIGTMDKSLN